MDTYIKQSINARHDSLFNAYEINDDKTIEEIEELFKKINEFGSSCKDVGDFESKFASNSLNQEYIDLFSKVALKFPAKALTAPVYDEQAHQESMIQDRTKHIVNEATRPIRRKIRWKIQDKMRDTPLGTVEQLSNLKGLFNKHKK